MLSGSKEGAAASLTTATEPRETASRANFAPSSLAPCNATKSPCGCALRESQATLRIKIPDCAAFRVAPVPMSSASSRCATLCVFSPTRFCESDSVTSLDSFSTTPVLILIPVFPAACSRFFVWCRGVKPHGNLGPAPDFRTSCGRLILSKAATNQNRVQAKPQTRFGYVAYGLAVKIGYGDVAAFIERNGYARRRLLFPSGSGRFYVRKRLVGLRGQIHGIEIVERIVPSFVGFFVGSLDELFCDRHIARHVEIWQHLFSDALENGRRSNSGFVQADGRIERNENRDSGIVDRRKPSKGSDQLIGRVAARVGINLLRGAGFTCCSPAI